MVYKTQTRYMECPHLTKSVCMTVEYIQVPGTNQYKRLNVHSCNCEQLNNCPLLDRYGRCPVQLSFPITM